MPRDNEVALVRALVARFPSLRPLLEEHVDYYDEILPHVFFGELTPHLVSLLPAAGSELRDILALLEETYASDPQLQELISVSFLENLPAPDESGAAIRDMLGPALTKQLARMW